MQCPVPVPVDPLAVESLLHNSTLHIYFAVTSLIPEALVNTPTDLEAIESFLLEITTTTLYL